MTQISLIQQTKLDFYNISVQDKPHDDCSQTIDIGIDIEDVEIHDRVYIVQQIHIVLEKLREDYIDFAQSIKGDIIEINIFREDTTLDNHIKLIEEFINYFEDTDIQYLTSIIRI